MTRKTIIAALSLGLLCSAAVAQTVTPGGAGSPSGAAGGDLSGTYPNPTVAKINGSTPGGYATISAGALSNSIAGNVSLANTANYYDGPTVSQGATGTWVAIGQVQITSTTADTFVCKLWDGTNVIAIIAKTIAANANDFITLSGFQASPAGDLRISCRDTNTTNGLIVRAANSINQASTIYVFRIN